jgi:hypothetical protein
MFFKPQITGVIGDTNLIYESIGYKTDPKNFRPLTVLKC